MTRQVKFGRRIKHRIFINADLEFSSPLVIGAQDPQDLVDLVVLKDPLTGYPLLPGSSMAGAVRDYLRQRKYGYKSDGSGLGARPWQDLLMGYQQGTLGEESWLITSDSISAQKIISLRDNLRVHSLTQTGENGAKFDYEILEPGAVFPLRFELLIPENPENEPDRDATLRQAAALALLGLELGEISFGAKKSRGLGRCQVKKWKVWDFDLGTIDGMAGWLSWDPQAPPLPCVEYDQVEKALSVNVSAMDARRKCKILTTLTIKDSLMIRSDNMAPEVTSRTGKQTEANAPDSVHLRSQRATGSVPILSGTSIAGSLRHRAEAILNTLNVPSPELILSKLFGSPDHRRPNASAVKVGETEISGVCEDWVQSRLKIDRFTGGAFPSALFDEMPLFPLQESNLVLSLDIEEPEDREIELLLHVVKDLMLADLTIGGESGIGRGAFLGKKIEIENKPDHWIIDQNESGCLSFSGTSDASALRCFEGVLKGVGNVKNKGDVS
jgi:CRISPR/Cas system CSM-associated protein Csm3 (group 7 of RAMP superfamily)